MISTMTWTQVYLGGLPQSLEPKDEEIENILDERFGLSNVDGTPSLWAGPGTTLVKRDNETGCCRGFAFVSFHSREGASHFVDKVNNSIGDPIEEKLPWGSLKAELSQPKTGKKNTKKKQQNSQQDHSDLRLRRQRKAPIRKHPVIVSSSGKRTNHGNKNR